MQPVYPLETVTDHLNGVEHLSDSLVGVVTLSPQTLYRLRGLLERFLFCTELLLQGLVVPLHGRHFLQHSFARVLVAGVPLEALRHAVMLHGRVTLLPPGLSVVEGLPELLAGLVLLLQLLAVKVLVKLPRLLHPNFWPRGALLQLSHRLLDLLLDAPSLYLPPRRHTLLR